MRLPWVDTRREWKGVLTFVIMGPKEGCETTMLRLTSIGNSTGVVLPKEILARLRVGRGDVLYVLETREGIELTLYDPEFARQMDLAEEIMHEERDVLRKLAE